MEDRALSVWSTGPPKGFLLAGLLGKGCGAVRADVA